jgi:transcription elongation factor Elf1
MRRCDPPKPRAGSLRLLNYLKHFAFFSVNNKDAVDAKHAILAVSCSVCNDQKIREVRDLLSGIDLIRNCLDVTEYLRFFLGQR